MTILQLGGFATAYGRNLREPAHHVADYDPVAAEMFTLLRGGPENEQLSRPSVFAAVVHRLAGLAEPPLRVPVGEAAVEYLDVALTTRRTQFESVAKTVEQMLADEPLPLAT